MKYLTIFLLFFPSLAFAVVPKLGVIKPTTNIPKIEVTKLGCDSVIITLVQGFNGLYDRARFFAMTEDAPTWWEISDQIVFVDWNGSLMVWAIYELDGEIVAQSNFVTFANNCEKQDCHELVESVFFLQNQIDSLKSIQPLIETVVKDSIIYVQLPPEIITKTDTIRDTTILTKTITEIRDTNLIWTWDFGEGFKPVFSLYPNPAETGKDVTLELIEGAEGFDMFVFNVLGQEVQKYLNNENKVVFSLEGVGVYILKIIVLSEDCRKVDLSKKLIIVSK